MPDHDIPTQATAATAHPAAAPIGSLMRAPKTAELIAGYLRRQIVRGVLKPGETLPPESNLMEQFGVSRPTLREAYRILEAESLIGVRRGARGGALVLAPDPMVAARHVALLLQLQGTTVQDVYEARMVSEPYCARLLARVRTEADLADLRAVTTELQEMVDAGYAAVPQLSRWSGVTYRFHEILLQRCGNKTLAIQGAVLADIVAAHMKLTLSKGMHEDEQPARFTRTIRSYTKLIKLLEAQDDEGAENHWRAHMEVAGKHIFKYDKRNKPLVDLFG